MDKASARHAHIIQYLLDQDCPVPSREIVHTLGINPNTFRKDIPHVARLLSEHGLQLQECPRGRFEVVGVPDSKEALRELLESVSTERVATEQRMWYVAGILLLSERIPTVEDLCELLDLSKPTVIKCIEHARSWLQRYRIRLAGALPNPGVPSAPLSSDGEHVHLCRRDTRAALWFRTGTRLPTRISRPRKDGTRVLLD